MKKELINAQNIEALHSTADADLHFLQAVQSERYKLKIAMAKLEKFVNEL